MVVENKFWAERLERDIKNLKKSAWNILYTLVMKYNYKNKITIRGLGVIDISYSIMKEKELWEQLTPDEKEYVSTLAGGVSGSKD